jgi:hypothetical protein
MAAQEEIDNARQTAEALLQKITTAGDYEVRGALTQLVKVLQYKADLLPSDLLSDLAQLPDQDIHERYYLEGDARYDVGHRDVEVDCSPVRGLAKAELDRRK